MKRRYLWLLVTCGCEIWHAPDRVRELEGRVDELTAEVSALSGKPVGVGKPAGDHVAPAPEHESGHAAPEPAVREDHAHDARPPVLAASLATPKSALKAKLATLMNKPEPAKPHWSYAGKTGPEVWGTLDAEWSTCASGKQQSPIDISPRAGSATPIEFHYKPTAATVVDNGHTIQVGFAAGSSISIDGHAYDLIQFHVHTPSEHAIAGERYPLEVHLVHKDAAGKLAVVGVLFDAGAESRALEPLAKWPKKRDVVEKLRRPFDPSVLLPATRTVYRYGGSLTTPPCSEGVVWSVMRRSMSVSKARIAAIAAHYKNARPLQPVGDRKVE